MANPEYSSPSAMELPSNIEALLESGLSYFFGERRGGIATQIYNVAGHPDLIVREHDEAKFLDDNRAALSSVYSEPEYSRYVLPSHLFVTNGKNYVVTAKVQGELFSDRLQGPTPTLLAQANGLYGSLGRYLCANMRRKGQIGKDIYEPHQYIHGTIAGDQVAKPRLADLPTSAGDLSSDYKSVLYRTSLFNWANAVVATETLTDTTLQTAREVTPSLLELTSQTEPDERWRKVINFILSEKHYLYRDDPLTQQILYGS